MPRRSTRRKHELGAPKTTRSAPLRKLLMQEFEFGSERPPARSFVGPSRPGAAGRANEIVAGSARRFLAFHRASPSPTTAWASAMKLGRDHEARSTASSQGKCLGSSVTGMRRTSRQELSNSTSVGAPLRRRLRQRQPACLLEIGPNAGFAKKGRSQLRRQPTTTSLLWRTGTDRYSGDVCHESPGHDGNRSGTSP